MWQVQKGFHGDYDPQGAGKEEDQMPFLQLFPEGGAHFHQLLCQDL
jgi:hypothetical protein